MPTRVRPAPRIVRPEPHLARSAGLWPLGLLLLGSGLFGCAGAYSTMQPGQVTPRNDFRVQLGAAGGVSPGQATDLYDAGEQATDSLATYLDSGKRQACDRGETGSCIAAGELRPVLDGVALQAMAPVASFDLLAGVRYGVLPRTDVGFRFGTAGWMADARWQFLGDPDGAPGRRGWDASVGLGYGRQTFTFPFGLDKVADALGMDENTRWDLRLPVLASYRLGEYGHLYGGVGYILSRWNLDIEPEFAYIDALPGGAASAAGQAEESFRSATAGAFAGTDTAGWVHQVTGVVGGLFGYRWVYVGLELNVIRYSFDYELMHEQQSHSGLVFYPAVSLLGEF